MLQLLVRKPGQVCFHTCWWNKVPACREQLNISMCCASNSFPCREESLASSYQQRLLPKIWQMDCVQSWLIGISVVWTWLLSLKALTVHLFSMVSSRDSPDSSFIIHCYTVTSARCHNCQYTRNKTIVKTVSMQPWRIWAGSKKPHEDKIVW